MKTPLERLLARVVRRQDGCWSWTGARNRWGYGQFWLNGKNHNASRAAYLLLVGDVPEGIVVCHSCDNPECCNPKHLWLGTQGDNVRDCNVKGRARGTFKGLRGARHPNYAAKLTPEKVREARRRCAAGESQSKIAREWGVNSGTISRAVRGEKWSFV